MCHMDMKSGFDLLQIDFVYDCLERYEFFKFGQEDSVSRFVGRSFCLSVRRIFKLRLGASTSRFVCRSVCLSVQFEFQTSFPNKPAPLD